MTKSLLSIFLIVGAEKFKRMYTDRCKAEIESGTVLLYNFIFVSMYRNLLDTEKRLNYYFCIHTF